MYVQLILLKQNFKTFLQGYKYDTQCNLTDLLRSNDLG